MGVLPEKAHARSIVPVANGGSEDLFLSRGRLPFKVAAFFWDSFRTWHWGLLRYIGFFHKHPEKVNQGEHAAKLLSGFSELLKMVIGTCCSRRPLNPTLSPIIGYYCYDLFRTVVQADRLHMELHDLASEIDPGFVADRGSCYICSMMRAFGTIIHSGLGNSWGHPMTWHSMASGNREGLFLTGLFRMALRRAGEIDFTPLERERLSHCYDLLIQLLYMTQAEAETRISGGVSVGIQQFRHEAESVLDGSVEDAETFALLGFGGRQIMKLRNLHSPEILEETMDKGKILIQQNAASIKNDYSQHVQKGFIGNNEGTVNFNDADPKQQEEPAKEAAPKAKAPGANPPNKEVQKLIRQILEESDRGYSALELYSELHNRNAIIPEWVQDKPQVNQYISSFIGALRKELEMEKKTISKSPYRIIPNNNA